MLPANAALRSQVSQLTLDISVTQARLAEMQTELVRAQRQLDSVTYPVLSLPTEIVSEILIHCLPTPTTKWRVDGVDSRQAPLLLSQICSQWRQIALSTPTLWKRLDINLRRRKNRAPDITETWLGRAHNFPLSVRLHGPTRDVDSKFSETFRRCAPRMQSLELDIFLDDLERMTSKSIEFLLLRKLSLRLLDGDDELPETFRVEMLKNVPQLSQVLLHQILPGAIVLPWQQLTRFTGELYYIPECLDALRLMPNLVECAVSVIETYGDYDDLEVFSHPQIRSFTLFHSMDHERDQEARSVQILSYMALPNLETLELVDVNYDDEFVLTVFFENGPTPPLKRLVVHPQSGEGRTTLPLTVAPFLRPHLTDLEIWHPDRGFTSDFFNRLGHDSAFMPGLEKLAFYCRYLGNEASQADLLRIAAGPVKSRRDMAGVTQLRVFHAFLVGSIYASPQEEDMAPFKELKAEGLDVYIGSVGGENHI
ncbi:hypothetical protein FB45DRAFT_425545 [Roridomyces roridus]|uniref:F-box domain-containing protein n=1 Tax=Roridomyces roridus TaxID=1738132 RepID=A0AAD7C5M2_9AGAR|nr:hypothetical protein FB45DRAFT_425545 [Roridomyces roridus]